MHPIYTDYEVSDWGKVRRRTVSKRLNYKKGKILKPYSNSGYLNINLSKNGETKYKKVHGLVLETFIGPRPEGFYCNHKDGIKTNNFVSNLEWVTPKRNTEHFWENNLTISLKGERNGNSKLKGNEVWLIKKLLKNNIPGNKIAKMFKVNKCTISDIKHERRWKHINL